MIFALAFFLISGGFIAIVMLASNAVDKSEKIKELKRENNKQATIIADLMLVNKKQGIKISELMGIEENSPEPEINLREESIEQVIDIIKPTEMPQEQKKAFNEYHKHQVEIKEEVLRDEREVRNVTILVTGAMCIVLSAIVFLMSTWGTMPNIVKTLVLGMLTTVFFGASYIAKSKFKLEKASDTFFYIAMAYIPIFLISISVFELLGTYLSIWGDGRYIYLSASALFIAVVYYYVSKNKNDNYMLCGSVLSQVVSLVIFTLVFSNDIVVVRDYLVAI